ncbi:MAG: NAD(P)-dependent oxidoreductase [Burkholderiales bacterium]|nr:NAD(P)-dependent oxidoreductase [Burkholderiales bacterium]
MSPAIGWIGLGRMGAPMAERLLGAGHAVRVWARRPEALASAVAAGAIALDTPEQLARECDVVATIVGGTADVAELHARMLPHARPGAVYLEMTTAAPAGARHSGELAARRGATVLDCPVSGGVAGARQGTLAQFVGGDPDAFARCDALLRLCSRHVVHCGASGSGYRMKLVNQTMIAATLLGLAEGVSLARAGGFDGQLVAQALGHGTAAGPLFASYAQRMFDAGGDVTFTLGLLRKDLRLAHDEAAGSGAPTRLLGFVLATLDEACAQHGEAAGVQLLAAATRRPAVPAQSAVRATARAADAARGALR